MMAFALLAYGLSLFVDYGGAAAETPTASSGKQWQLVFGDEFDGSSLDSSKWITCYDRYYNSEFDGCTNSGNNELQWYTDDQVGVANGYARLTAKPQSTQGRNWITNALTTYPYVSGMISTGKNPGSSTPKFSATYGYYEARIRMPAGQGIWPAFWLITDDNSWPPEIDIMELLGHEPTKMYMTYHWGADYTQHQYSTTSYSGSNFSADWHTFAVHWKPGAADWYVDNVLRRTVTSSNISTKSMEIIINLAVGGNWPGSPNGSTVFPAYMDIDYVRAYQEVDQSVEEPAPVPESSGSSASQPTTSATADTTPGNTYSGGDAGLATGTGIIQKTTPVVSEDQTLTRDDQTSPVSSEDVTPEAVVQATDQPESSPPVASSKRTLAIGALGLGSISFGLAGMFLWRHVLHVRQFVQSAVAVIHPTAPPH